MSGPFVAANDIVEKKLDELLDGVSAAFDGDVFSWNGPVAFGVDTPIRRAIEQRRNADQSEHLVIILTTEGGVVEVIQRVVETIRRHYKKVSFVIPDYAYSAGTVFAMAGDAIYMDYYSRLGPIDPQIERNNRFVPALGYCERYDALIEKSKKESLTDAEIAVLIGSFDQAELYEFEQARLLSISLVTDWLVTYKFKDWKETETHHKPVTMAKKKQRAPSPAS